VGVVVVLIAMILFVAMVVRPNNKVFLLSLSPGQISVSLLSLPAISYDLFWKADDESLLFTEEEVPKMLRESFQNSLKVVVTLLVYNKLLFPNFVSLDFGPQLTEALDTFIAVGRMTEHDFHMAGTSSGIPGSKGTSTTSPITTTLKKVDPASKIFRYNPNSKYFEFNFPKYEDMDSKNLFDYEQFLSELDNYFSP